MTDPLRINSARADTPLVPPATVSDEAPFLDFEKLGHYAMDGTAAMALGLPGYALGGPVGAGIGCFVGAGFADYAMQPDDQAKSVGHSLIAASSMGATCALAPLIPLATVLKVLTTALVVEVTFCGN